MGVVVLEFPGEKARWGIIEVLAVLVLVFGVGITMVSGATAVCLSGVSWLVKRNVGQQFILGYLVHSDYCRCGFYFALLVRKNSIQAWV